MARITAIGGTGYAGSGVVKAAVARGHAVTSYSRSLPGQQVNGGGALVASGPSHPVRLRASTVCVATSWSATPRATRISPTATSDW